MELRINRVRINCSRPVPATMKLGQGHIFTSVCLSTGGRGVCLSACWDIHPPGADPPEQTSPPSRPPREQTHTPPRKQTPAYGQRAVGTHPTGMHSCYITFDAYQIVIMNNLSTKIRVPLLKTEVRSSADNVDTNGQTMFEY